MTKRVLIGTNNPSKLAQFSAFFDPETIECVSPASIGLTVKPPENKQSAAENALQKALFFHKETGLPVLTEDSGLIFLDLPFTHPDQPGIRVRRPINHPPLDDDEEMLRYYQALIHRHGGRLRAAWQDAWCFMISEKDYSIHADPAATLERHAMVLVDKPCLARKPGWPLDSLTLSATYGKYWAELTADQCKDARLHEFSGFEEDRRNLLVWLNNAVKKIL